MSCQAIYSRARRPPMLDRSGYQRYLLGGAMRGRIPGIQLIADGLEAAPGMARFRPNDARYMASALEIADCVRTRGAKAPRCAKCAEIVLLDLSDA